MTPKTIATNMAVVGCDVCGRTLLRGENADVFLHSGARRTVCELCTSRAMHEGWIREGVDVGLARQGGERGGARSLLGRLRQRRFPEREPGAPDEPAPVGATAMGDTGPAADPHEPPVAPVYDPATYDPAFYDPDAMAAPAPAPPAPEPSPLAPGYEPPREPRSFRAVPTNDELKIARALTVFNASDHPRTVAGVSRSLGAPMVSAQPSRTEGSVVTIAVGWELSWYRYEIDLGDEAAGARKVAQGAELYELEDAERVPNAAADEAGVLHPVPASVTAR